MENALSARPALSAFLAVMIRIWRSRLGLFLALAAVPIAALVAMGLLVFFVIAPNPTGLPLREVWMGMAFLQKLSIVLLFLFSIGCQYWSLAASGFATQELWNQRPVTFGSALGSVRFKQLRLFWIILFAGMFTGPLGFIVGPALLFAFAAGFPVAFLEGKSAFASVKRGGELLKAFTGKVSLLVLLFLASAVVAVVAWLRLMFYLSDLYEGHLPLYLRPISPAVFWLVMILPQLFYMTLTVIYLHARQLEANAAAELPAATPSN